jgi:hypothetical protein
MESLGATGQSRSEKSTNQGAYSLLNRMFLDNRHRKSLAGW